MSKKIFVSPTSDGWKVQRVGTGRAAGLFDTKVEAVHRGIEISKNQNAELFVQNLDGKIGWKNSYGNDPERIRG